jgi:hypothetical protein
MISLIFEYCIIFNLFSISTTFLIITAKLKKISAIVNRSETDQPSFVQPSCLKSV